MISRGRDDDVNLEAAVLDALEGVMCPATAMRVVLTALRYADRSALPRDPEAMSRFVVGPLREAVEEAVGLAAYESVSDRLSPLLIMASSGVRRRAPASGRERDASGVVHTESARGTARTSSADLLLVVTRDPAFVSALSRRLTDAIELAPAERAIDLLTRAQRAQAAGRATLAVVDALLPSVDLATLSAMGLREDARFDVVLVGATAEQLRRIRHQIPASRRWIACDLEHAADLAARELERVRLAG